MKKIPLVDAGGCILELWGPTGRDIFCWKLQSMDRKYSVKPVKSYYDRQALKKNIAFHSRCFVVFLFSPGMMLKF